jgi:hypothetical protein
MRDATRTGGREGLAEAREVMADQAHTRRRPRVGMLENTPQEKGDRP